MNTKESMRPEGCAFDVYGAEEETLRNLTCENCLVSGMVCEYRGLATLGHLVKTVDRSGQMSLVSKP